jgi:hypothetical protein
MFMGARMGPNVPRASVVTVRDAVSFAAAGG